LYIKYSSFKGEESGWAGPKREKKITQKKEEGKGKGKRKGERSHYPYQTTPDGRKKRKHFGRPVQADIKKKKKKEKESLTYFLLA